ncbi:MAG TPA: hypothetical protein VEG84_08815 [Thermoanaerobaculia bacterium]|nr:hypothetical protein [Thermoanaerobaculia bacterium]
MPHRNRSSHARLLPSVLLVAACSACAAWGAPIGPPAQARLVGPISLALARSVQAAVEGAALRLSDTGCSGVLAQFADSRGRPLTEVLEGSGQTSGDYLTSLLFLDGTATRPCQNALSLAWTSPGSRGVFVCGLRFVQMARRDPRYASIVVIHEEAHALGLGENPPSSAEITARIAGRCR